MSSTGTPTPEEKLKKVIDYVNSELSKSLAGLETAVGSVSRAVGATVLPVAAPAEEPKTEVARIIQSLILRVGRAERTVRAVESACSEREMRARRAEFLCRDLSLQNEALQRKHEEDHQKLIALQSESDKRKLRDKADLFSLLDPSAVLSSTSPVPLSSASTSSDGLPRSPRHRHTESVGLPGANELLSEQPPPADIDAIGDQVSTARSTELVNKAESLLQMIAESVGAPAPAPAAAAAAVSPISRHLSPPPEMVMPPAKPKMISASCIVQPTALLKPPTPTAQLTSASPDSRRRAASLLAMFDPPPPPSPPSTPLKNSVGSSVPSAPLSVETTAQADPGQGHAETPEAVRHNRKKHGGKAHH